ncbi:hypothetical protein [Saccharothrix deserti]|uniref:hypothetical protein n=1 Tax=Saccharothrix deserti TaxID=2593674 RepID=UPI00131CEF18|nr:hypothetical protein [Saccharothrix deserti]
MGHTVRRLVTVMELFTGNDPSLRELMAGFFREHGAGVLKDMMTSDVGDGCGTTSAGPCAQE